uniref:Secreted protein n=1 Tax=Steinernema glaseri TaxID=37863 RepID=A0A1I7Z280_9BILA
MCFLVDLFVNEASFRGFFLHALSVHLHCFCELVLYLRSKLWNIQEGNPYLCFTSYELRSLLLVRFSDLCDCTFAAPKE